MWVFAYGSLMWDGWEREFQGARFAGATLHGFHRSFNKASSMNWGTRERRGPTLGLEPDANGAVVGIAFSFPDDKRAEILAGLGVREGRSFALKLHAVSLPGEPNKIDALVPVNDRHSRTYIGNLNLSERVAMARVAIGTSGACADYARRVGEQLHLLAITDAHVQEFVKELEGVPQDQ